METTYNYRTYLILHLWQQHTIIARMETTYNYRTYGNNIQLSHLSNIAAMETTYNHRTYLILHLWKQHTIIARMDTTYNYRTYLILHLFNIAPISHDLHNSFFSSPVDQEKG